MIPIETLLLFISASVALALVPGPDNIFVLTQSALYGRKAGIWITLGLCTGLLLHTALVSLGVAALIQTSPLAFTLLKTAGAIYLLYLAYYAFKASTETLGRDDTQAMTWQALYRRGIIMNITNPKVAIFFLSFLPQFVSPGYDYVTLQILSLGGVFILSALLVFTAIACFAGLIGERLQSSNTAQRALNRLAGVVFVGLALRLAMSSQ